MDLDARAGLSYRYRVLLLDAQGREVARVEKELLVSEPKPPAPVQRLRLEGRREVTLRWDYPPYRGGAQDLAVGFLVYRQRVGGQAERITPVPVLRLEGQLAYVDREAEEGASYLYSVEAVDLLGVRSPAVRSAAFTLADTTAPLAPLGVTAADTAEGVLVVWSASAELDVDHYDVFRGSGLRQPFQRINPSPVAPARPRFLDAEAQRGRSWFYKVAAVDRAGNSSELSGPAAIVPADAQPPAAVRDLQATVEEGRVRLSWAASGEPDLKGYQVYRGFSPDKMLRLTGEPLPAGQRPSYAGFRLRRPRAAPRPAAHLRGDRPGCIAEREPARHGGGPRSGQGSSRSARRA